MRKSGKKQPESGIEKWEKKSKNLIIVTKSGKTARNMKNKLKKSIKIVIKNLKPKERKIRVFKPKSHSNLVALLASRQCLCSSQPTGLAADD